MKNLWLTAVLVLLFLMPGCAGNIRPLSPSPDAVIRDSDRSVSLEKEGVLLRVRVQEPVFSAFGDEPFCSFYISVTNRTYKGLRFPYQAFVLEDDSGVSHPAIKPQILQELLSPQSQFLLPYPYIGYYYSTDIEVVSANLAFESPLRYSGKNHAREILEEALPETPALPGKTLEGMVYFPLDLLSQKSFVLKINLSEVSPAGKPGWIFPFSVEK